MISDEKNLDSSVPSQENPLRAIPKKLHDNTASEKKSALEQSPLRQVRNTLYLHIKNTSVSKGSFFMQQEKNHKRELVAIMRRIDNQQISSVHDLLDVMQQLAMKHQSETFNTILHSIKDIIEPHLDVDSSISPPGAS